jgi:hypothetical protein
MTLPATTTATLVPLIIKNDASSSIRRFLMPLLTCPQNRSMQARTMPVRVLPFWQYTNATFWSSRSSHA